MSRWAQAKQLVDLDWRAEWHDIAQGTMGELDHETVQEALGLVNQLDAAYQRKDKAGFLALKASLVNHRSWTGSQPISSGSPNAGCTKPTAAPTQLGYLT